MPVFSSAAVSHEDLVLEADDGNRFATFAALPARRKPLETLVDVPGERRP